jgi:two-component system, NarL family, response regulator LiaR
MHRKISIIEDNLTFAHLLAQMINQDKDLEVANIYNNIASALDGLQNNPVDLVLVDIQLPDGSGNEAIKHLRPLMPKTKFLICTSFDDDAKIYEGLKAGSSGYIVKNDDPDLIVSYIRDVFDGGAPMSPGIATKVIKFFHEAALTPNLEVLSQKENDILLALSKGAMYKEIAAQFNISLDTIKKHCGNIYRKLEVSNRTEAVNLLFQRN